MTPVHLLKWAILRKAASWGQFELADDPLTPEQIDALYEEHDKDWGLQDAREEIRASGTRTDVRDPTPWTRGLDNYENQSSAMQAPDGTWVGWTYWYGGGKYAEPSAIPWLDYAYALSCEEKQVTITQRTFTKIENPKTS